MKIIAINGRAFNAAEMRAAIVKGKTSPDPLELIVENTGTFKVVKLDYHGGERFPVLERVLSVPDRLDDILKPLAK
jgi:hypothetical protein